MRKRMLVSLTLIFLVAALVGGATFALFTDEATNANNAFATGTVDIVLNDDNADEITFFNLEDIAPGDSGNVTIKVANAGSLEFRYDVALDVEGDLFALPHPILVTLKAGSNVIFSSSQDGTFDVNRVLDAGASEDLTLEWSFPKEAGNEYQGKSGSFSITFSAEQTKNNPI